MLQLGLRELIRYFFTGLAVLVGVIVFGMHSRLEEIDKWFKDNAWVKDFSPLVVIFVPALILIVGYCAFFAYRLLGYRGVIIILKRCFARKGNWCYSYRELLCEWVNESCEKHITMWQAEDLYKYLRTKFKFEYWDDQASQFTSGIHLLYIVSFVVLIGFPFSGNEWWVVLLGIAAGIGLFAVALASDVFFERQELFYFLAEEAKVRKQLVKLSDHPAWRDLPPSADDSAEPPGQNNA